MSRLVVDGVDVGPVEVAATWARRGRGLLGVDVAPVPLWFPGVRGVHTLGMRIPIDVAFVDKGGRVVDVVAPMVPWRMGRTRWRARHVLEAGAGTFQSLALEVGSIVVVEP